MWEYLLKNLEVFYVGGAYEILAFPIYGLYKTWWSLFVGFLKPGSQSTEQDRSFLWGFSTGGFLWT